MSFLARSELQLPLIVNSPPPLAGGPLSLGYSLPPVSGAVPALPSRTINILSRIIADLTQIRCSIGRLDFRL